MKKFTTHRTGGAPLLGRVVRSITLITLLSLAGTMVLAATPQKAQVKKTATQQVKKVTPNQSTMVQVPAKYVGQFSISHYCPCPKCTGRTGKPRTATGHTPKEGRTIAADPKIIPLHSVVYIEGLGTYVVEDVGGSIKGNRLDVFVSSHQKALQLGTLGNKRLKVYILK